ncbi:MAG: DUF6359 domain-containing protein [Bacteroidales bacterium]|nr:DUF6359 domain-containing protein [Bacteroidales bacterium]MDD7232756.1 DUF6359 domain-containing protein [Bacteroidales bacterium]MDY2705168.1 DUF6359 domain-containing protein [Alloprevotella sp.]
MMRTPNCHHNLQHTHQLHPLQSGAHCSLICARHSLLYIIGMCLLATLVGCGDIDFSEDKVTSPPSIDSTKVDTAEYISVAEALALPLNSPATIRGIIVGTIQGTTFSKFTEGLNLESPNTNLVIGDSLYKGNTNQYMAVRLPANSDYRELFNLKDHPELLHRTIIISTYGLEKYFGRNGITNIAAVYLVPLSEEDDNTGGNGDNPGENPPPTDNPTLPPTPIINDTTTYIPEGR